MRVNLCKEQRKARTGFLFCLALLFASWIQAESPPVLEVGKFSAAQEGALPPDWKPLTFPKIGRHTIYKAVKEDGIITVKAMSEASASGLIRKVTVDLTEYPILAWRWKVANVLKNGDVTKKDGDDSPARIYVMFEKNPGKVSVFEKAKFEAYKLIYGQYPPLTVNYIWASKAPQGTIVRSPYTNRSMLIVVESGPSLINQWVNEQRNVFLDFKEAFGEEPPLVSGIAIMTDTDNTGESAIAHYGDIVFKKTAGDLGAPSAK